MSDTSAPVSAPVSEATSAQTSAPVPSENATAPAKFRIKDGDAEVELSEDEVRENLRLKREYSKRQEELEKMKKSSYERFQASAKLAKDAKALVDSIKNGRAEDILNHPDVGPSLKQAVIKELAWQHDFAKLTPEQQALVQRELAIAEKEEHYRRAEENERAEKERSEKEQEISRAHGLLLGILERGDVPQTPLVAHLLGRELKSAWEAGYEVSEPELIERTTDVLRGSVHEYAEKLSDDKFLDFFGDVIRKRMRKLEMAQYTKNSAQKSHNKTLNKPDAEMSYTEWLKSQGIEKRGRWG